MIYDTHAHLDQLEDIAGALQRAKEADVKGIVCPSMDLKSCQVNLNLKKNAAGPKIFIGFGMHPSEANAEEAQAIVALIRENKDLLHAVGEIGLDYWYKDVRKNEEKKEAQRVVFKTCLKVAQEHHLPVIIHSRGAWSDCLKMTVAAGIKKAVFHWYSGPVDILEEILAAGYYVSASPSLAYSPPSQEAIKHAPIERTLIETDSPVYYRNEASGDGFRAEPKDVYRTLTAYSQLKSLTEDKAKDILNKNAEAFFSLL